MGEEAAGELAGLAWAGAFAAKAAREEEAGGVALATAAGAKHFERQ